MVSLLVIAGNIMFYIGVIGSVIAGLRYIQPITSEYHHKPGECNISRITYRPLWCECDSVMCMYHISLPYYCWEVQGHFTSMSGSVSQYHTLSPTISTKSKHSNCFVTFGKGEYYRCSSTENVTNIVRINVDKYLPMNLVYLDAYYANKHSTPKVQKYNDSGEQFPCYMQSSQHGRNETILEKQEHMFMIAITPSFVLIALVGLWLVKNRGQGWLKQLGEWFYDELLLFILCIPYNLVCWIVYIIALLLYNCLLGRDIGWTWDEYMHNGGICCLCYMYYRDRECPVSCCRQTSDDSRSVPSNDGTYNTRQPTQTFSDDQTNLDLPPSYSDFFQNDNALASTSDCELPKYGDLNLEGSLPPVYEIVVQNQPGTSLDEALPYENRYAQRSPGESNYCDSDVQGISNQTVQCSNDSETAVRHDDDVLE